KKKHVLSEQQNTISEEKMDAVSSFLLLQNQITESDLKLLKEIQDLQADSREKRLQEDSSIKQLKLGELKKLEKEEVQLKKRISTAQQENHCLNETLQEVQQKLSELHGQVEEHKHSKEYMEKYRAQQKVVKKELTDLTVEHELLLQAFQKVQEERDELLKRQTESILDIQQRSGLKKILLRKKLAAVTETLEKKEAQLSAALSVCSIEPTARSNAVSKLDVRCDV
ncbi:hypothetical protein XENOCAPTIV_009782, partial [Xenoophorus captivus]